MPSLKLRLFASCQVSALGGGFAIGPVDWIVSRLEVCEAIMIFVFFLVEFVAAWNL